MAIREMADILASHGLRPTQQRLAVYEFLLRHPVHPTADTIYQAITEEYPTFSRTTIYNSLHALLEAGLIRTLNICAEEQRFDGNPIDHGHFLCTRCNGIFDFPFETESLKHQFPAGFTADTTDVFAVGICAACRQVPQ